MVTGSGGWTSAAGVALGIGASILNAFGIVSQKMSLMEHPDKAMWSQRRWLFGFSLLLVAAVMDFASIGLASQSLVAPLASLGLVWNLYLAQSRLSETIGRREVWGTAFILLGTVLAVMFADHDAQSFTLGQLRQLYYRTPMKIYLVAVPCIMLGHYYAYVRYVNMSGKDRARFRPMGIVSAAGLAGWIGGQSLLFAKSSIELVKSAIRGDSEPFKHVTSYAIIVAMVLCLSTQILVLNDGLRNFDAVEFVPVYQFFWVISGIAGGLVYFDEWSRVNNTRKGMFLLGSLVALVGIWKLSSRTRGAQAKGGADEEAGVGAGADDGGVREKLLKGEEEDEEAEETDDDGKNGLERRAKEGGGDTPNKTRSSTKRISGVAWGGSSMRRGSRPSKLLRRRSTRLRARKRRGWMFVFPFFLLLLVLLVVLLVIPQLQDKALHRQALSDGGGSGGAGVAEAAQNA